MILKPRNLRPAFFRLVIAGATAGAVAVLLAGCDGSGGQGASGTSSATTTVDAESIDASVSAASEYFHTRDLLKAEAILARLIDRAPHEPPARELYGQVLLARAAEAREQGDHEQLRELQRRAYEQYTTLLELRPDVAGLHRSTGQLAQMLELDDAALGHYRDAMELDTADPQSPFFAAQVLVQRGEHDEARELLERAIRLNPEHALAHASLANIESEQGDFAAALERIHTARRLVPTGVSYRVIEASILRRQGDPKRAIELLVGLGANVRAEQSVAREIAASYAALENHVAAAEAWINCFRSQPRSEWAWSAAVAAAEHLRLAGEREQAWTWLEQAKLLAPSQINVRELEARLRDGARAE